MSAPASRPAVTSVADATPLLVRNVRPWGGANVDLLVADGEIREIRERTAPDPATASSPPSADATGEAAGMRVVDGRGLLALPGFANVHAHTDKSWWGKPWIPYGGVPTRDGRIEHERTHRDALGIPGVEVSTAVLREYLRHGTTVQRTHIDVDPGVGLRGIEVVREAVAALDHTVSTQIVAFPQDGVLRRPGMVRLLEDAARAGVDYIGGIDPASLDRDPVGQLDAIFAIAAEHGIGVDVHLHDGGELGAFQIELMAERTVRHGLQGKVNVAHGFAVGDLPRSDQEVLVAAMSEAGLSMTTVAPIGASPLPLEALIAAGVPVGLGTDGFRDLWGPYGDGDMLKLALRLAQTCGLRRDEQLQAALEVATSAGAAFAGLSSHDLGVGDRADIVLLDAENPQDALTRTPRREVVVAGGKLVVADGELLV